MENALIKQETALANTNRPLESLWHESLARDVRAGQISQATAETYERGFRKFTEWGASNPERATDHAIKEWLGDLREKGISQNAISVWFAGVRAFFAWTLSEGHLTVDPTHGIKRGKRNQTNKRHLRKALTADEVLRVLRTSLSPRDRALLSLLVYTGARGIELHRASVEDLDTIKGEVVLYVQGKGQTANDTEREFVVIAHPNAKDALYNYLAERKTESGPLFSSESNRSEGSRLTMRSIRRIVKQAFGDAGIVDRKKTTHSLRHTAATVAIANGASLRNVQKMLRHSSVTTTEIYTFESERVENAAEKLINYETCSNIANMQH